MPSKSYREFAASIIETLESLGLQYAIGGSFASSTYGEARTTMTNATAMLYSPEDVVIYKLKYFLMGRSQKHLRDIGAILIVQGTALDYNYIAHWAQEIGATEVWNHLLAEYRRASS